MNLRVITAIAFSIVLGLATHAQDAPPPGPQNGASPSGSVGQRDGMRAMGMGAIGRGVVGTVTEVAADHYTVKTFEGKTYTVHYSANTRFIKQSAGMRGQGGQGNGQNWRGQRDGHDAQAGGGNPPQTIKPADIKVGDAIDAMGETDASAKSIGAAVVALVDPERAKQIQEMEANYGKTWLMGKVIAINDVQVTLDGSVDNASHTFVADENTAFRNRRNPITLADIHVGDMVRVDGSVKDGAFTAAVVNVMNMSTNAPQVPRSAPPQ